MSHWRWVLLDWTKETAKFFGMAVIVGMFGAIAIATFFLLIFGFIAVGERIGLVIR